MNTRKILLGSLVGTAAIGAALALAGPASAATVNHGQCVSGAVKAGVTGAAFEAIAKNNSLVGAYGSATCPAPIVVAPAPDKATSDNLTWDFNDGTTHITGTTTFNVDKDGSGALTYTASDGHVLYGTVTPGTYQKINATTAVFGGTITAGSSADYLANPLGGNYFTVKIVDGGAPQDGHGDIIAVLANQDGSGHWLTSADPTPSIDYPMGVGTAGIVTTGNLTID
jgi:hypothetical protein